VVAAVMMPAEVVALAAVAAVLLEVVAVALAEWPSFTPEVLWTPSNKRLSSWLDQICS
jgi:hypothetical protein